MNIRQAEEDRNPRMKRRSKAGDIGDRAKEMPESNPRAEAEARYKTWRDAVANKSFGTYDLDLVAMIAALVSGQGRPPEDAAKQALKILDACREALLARAPKLETMLNAPVPPQPEYSFPEGVRVITQQNRSDRAEEYFRRFLSPKA